jgi:hypothetical protein
MPDQAVPAAAAAVSLLARGKSRPRWAWISSAGRALRTLRRLTRPNHRSCSDSVRSAQRSGRRAGRDRAGRGRAHQRNGSVGRRLQRRTGVEDDHHLREREKELEKQAREYQRLQQDDSAFKEFVSQRGYEIPDDEIEEPEYDLNEDPTRHPQDGRRAPPVEAAAGSRQGADRVPQDIDAKAERPASTLTRSTVTGSFRSRSRAALPRTRSTRRSILAERNKQLEQAAIERYLASKRAPTPPQPGKAGAPEFDPRDRRARQARLRGARRRRRAVALSGLPLSPSHSPKEGSCPLPGPRTRTR